MTIANFAGSLASAVVVTRQDSGLFSSHALEDSSLTKSEHHIQKKQFLRHLGASKIFKILNDPITDQSFNSSDAYDDDDEYGSNDIKSRFDCAFGTYMVHGELILAVADFSDSPYSSAMPWKDSFNSNWNIDLKPYGLYRSFFNNGAKGNYQNFYDMAPISSAFPYYSKSKIPLFYASEGNCSETTFLPKQDPDGYEEYKPFFIENCGYTRSYFYGMNY